METQNRRVYLDYNATTPLAKEVQTIICNILQDSWQNPSSNYLPGCNSKKVVEEARTHVARMIGALQTEIIFTSGGTESNNMVIYSALGRKDKSDNCKVHPHIVSTNVEHDSVRLILKHLQDEEKIDVTFVPVSKDLGKVHVHDIIGAVRANTCLISVMLANNETGIIQPVVEIGEELKKINKARKMEKLSLIYLHTDAAQAIGKVNVDVRELGVDYLTIVGHKFYGPRIGALYVRDLHLKTVSLSPIFYGGGQEMSYRPGTENTPMIAGLGKAAQLVQENLEIYNNHMIKMNTYLQDRLVGVFQENVVFNNFSLAHDEILPNTTSVGFPQSDLTGQEILQRAAMIDASTGAACHSGNKSSAVLQASGVSNHLAARTLRFSIGRETQKEDIDYAVDHLHKVLTTTENSNTYVK